MAREIVLTTFGVHIMSYVLTLGLWVVQFWPSHNDTANSAPHPWATGKVATHGPNIMSPSGRKLPPSGLEPAALRPSGSNLRPSGDIIFGPRAATFPVSRGLGCRIVTLWCGFSRSGAEELEDIGEGGTHLWHPFIGWKIPNIAVFPLRTASLSHLRTMLPESSSCSKPAQRPIHAT